MSEELRERACGIQLFVMDVDGTLTDSAMYYSADGEELKRFSTRDGMGITLLHRAGIQTAIITSEQSAIVSARAAKLKIHHVILGCHNKTDALTELAAKLEIPLGATAYIGDDINDMHVMRVCGLSACPSDAVPSIRETAMFVSANRGGHGAVREFAEHILISNNQPITIPERW